MQPANQCEDSEISSNDPGKKSNTKIDKKNTGLKIDTDKYTGLCRDCELRKTCEILSPDKVIWHCEEYR